MRSNANLYLNLQFLFFFFHTVIAFIDSGSDLAEADALSGRETPRREKVNGILKPGNQHEMLGHTYIKRHRLQVAPFIKSTTLVKRESLFESLVKRVSLFKRLVKRVSLFHV